MNCKVIAIVLFCCIHVGSAHGQTAAFECPTAPMEIEFSKGTKARLTGTQANGACVAEVTNRTTGETATFHTYAPGASINAAQGVPARVRFLNQVKAQMWPLQVGKRFTLRYEGTGSAGTSGNWDYVYTVDAVEKITTPAGVFDTFKVTEREDNVAGDYSHIRITWYAPSLRATVKYDFSSKNRHRGPFAVSEEAIKVTK